MTEWISSHMAEIFGAVTGILYVFLEIRRNILLWPLGILTSAVYIFIFAREGFYASAILQVYYVVISIYGWIEWRRGGGSAGDNGKGEKGVRKAGRLTAVMCAAAAVMLWGVLWIVLDRYTDSPVPVWDGLITSLSVVATWMLTRRIIEQWYVWIAANAVAVTVYLAVGLFPTAVLFGVYTVMAVIGLAEWKKDLLKQPVL